MRPNGFIQNGFTLVEMLVVITVMALLAGMAVLTFDPLGGGPKDAASRFASRVSAARDEAILTGRPVSAWVTPSGYGFEQLRDGRWERLDQRPFEGADWGRGMRVALSDGGSGRGRVAFDSLGVTDRPLDVRLSAAGRSARVHVGSSGEVIVE